MTTIFDFVTAPAPRYLMRLALIERLIESVPRTLHCFLEIGPGLGDVSSYVRNLRPMSRGVLLDFSKDGAGILAERFRMDKAIDVLCVDFQRYESASRFGLIMAFEVLEHIADDVGALEKIARLLEPGGVFLFSVPAFKGKWQQADRYVGHVRRYEREEILRKCSAAGLRIDTIWCFGFPLIHLLYPFRQAYYAVQLSRNPGDTKESATKRSAVERPLSKTFARFPLLAIFRPFFLLQDAAKRTDMGDGFVAMARRLE